MLTYRLIISPSIACGGKTMKTDNFYNTYIMEIYGIHRINGNVWNILVLLISDIWKIYNTSASNTSFLSSYKTTAGIIMFILKCWRLWIAVN